VKWMIKIRKRYLKRRGQATNHISWSARATALRQSETPAILNSLEGTLQGRTVPSIALEAQTRPGRETPSE
jgi:hypothetical protein